MNRPGLLVGVLAFLVAPVILTAADPPELTPEQRMELEKKATELNRQAGQLHRDGQYSRGTELLWEVLKMRQQLYPKDKHPQGHPQLVQSLNNLGLFLQAQGEYAKAEQVYHEAVLMNRQLYPKDKYPQGHALLAQQQLSSGPGQHERRPFAGMGAVNGSSSVSAQSAQPPAPAVLWSCRAWSSLAPTKPTRPTVAS